MDTQFPPPPETDPRPKFDESTEAAQSPEPSIEMVNGKLDHLIGKFAVGIGNLERDVNHLKGLYTSFATSLLKLQSQRDPMTFPTRSMLVLIGAAIGGSAMTLGLRIVGVSTVAAVLSSCLGTR